MHRAASKRVTRSSGSGLKQTNVEINPTVDKVSEQGKTSDAGGHMPNDAKVNGHLHHEVVENGKGKEEQKPTPQTVKKRSNTNTKISGSHRELVIGLPCRGQFEIHQRSRSSTSSKRLGGGGERNVLFASHKGAQRSKEDAGSSSVAANSTPVGRPKKRNKTMKKGEVREDDEYTRIKKKLRYFLNRISYEQNLIDAYSLEGWKGSSLEKIRPEKELERATKEILRRKLKIRDLFQHLDTLCAEGSLPESLFDSDGEISSEDIFCAKCGSKDLSVDNDIILCDGFCDRGFHQYCLEPPLRKEDIPPDDEGWLCPGCDCKDDSLDLLNDSLGTKFSVSDSWEKIFPEAAAALAGGGQNLDCDLPSDDSDDEEYDPDGLNDNENDEDGSDDNEESENEDGSSDESEFTSASDEMIESFKEGKDIMKDIMALPSDDSEDDDYDPDAPTCDEEKESSNSDCTSDSEELETSFKGDKSNQQAEDTPLEDPGRQTSQLPCDAILESDVGLDDGSAGVSRRRNVERLNYKKLYDEEYDNGPTSSSDDEDWDKTARMGKEDSESEDEGDCVPLKQSSNAEDHTSKKPRRKSKRTDKKDTLEAPQESPGENGGSGEIEKSSSSANKQTDPKTQRLYVSFQENRYPDKATKESLAKELQMTVMQVNNWFKNRRSSINSKPLVSEENVEKLKTGKEGECETSVAGSSVQTMETESVAENKSRASESINTGSRKRRRK
ncbi:Homeobox domain [Arabidopsis thaliana x Arabidopsis arenosa]|uniref:Homeobox domain n=1 Tax=Arabidopsis thaliana x Arabidopsis arenosa TaxID=1240361 RepID=A0A8T2ATE1_9BRAS|nr:Homeobox domain [Arabidopsis thaliana x Arabidopsis arenosa]KAG7577869.1 Homeobox domain [Arabidopsis thaliana x Arabidopsis arenosa]KAG7577870.1 Homeobox domain [Arabidopsis thaliana x Arabidopsis arenosa]